MKKISFNIFAIILITLLSCENNDDIKITSGVTGNIKYGMGDCMPVIDESTRVYSNFNGDLYFIVKSNLENLGEGDFDELKANSIKKTIKNGKLAIELPMDTFLVMPSDVYLYSDYNTRVRSINSSNFKLPRFENSKNIYNNCYELRNLSLGCCI